MAAAPLLLGMGSLVLWIGVIVAPPGWFYFSTLYFIIIPAIFLHVSGWAITGVALMEYDVKTVREAGYVRRMQTVFALSVLVFLIGVAFLGIENLALIGFFGPEDVAVRRFLLLTYIPSVYAPVVATHAALFAIGSRGLSDVVRSMLIASGSLFLFLVAAFSLYAQGFLFSNQVSLVFTLSGVTSIGYFLIGIGWLVTAIRHSTSSMTEGAHRM
jgi:hypothetical protein